MRGGPPDSSLRQREKPRAWRTRGASFFTSGGRSAGTSEGGGILTAQQPVGGLVLLDGGKAAQGLIKPVVGGVVVATRSTDLLRKVEGQRIYSQEVILGTGQDTGTKAIRYYFDGENAWDSENTDGADISINNTSGLPVTADWGEYREYEGDIAEQNRVLTEHLTTYDFSKSDYLSDKHNDTVYKVGDVYYCTMTLDCSEEMMNTVHKAARDEFIANTGAEEEGFSIEDTTIDFAIAEIDGEYKFVAWRRNEDYSGKRAGIAGGVSCTQTCYSTYSYEGYEITEELPQ